jgi:hypothetical protein
MRRNDARRLQGNMKRCVIALAIMGAGGAGGSGACIGDPTSPDVPPEVTSEATDEVTGTLVLTKHVYRDLPVQPLFRMTTSLPANVVHTFTTEDLQPTSGLVPDTFLVVTRGGVSWSNDNCSAGTQASCVTVPPVGLGVTLPYTITVFPPLGLGRGTLDLRRDGLLLANDAPFGGMVIRPTVPVDGLPYAIQTVHTPGGVTDSQMVLYDGDWQQRAYDNNGGVGMAAKVTAVIGFDDVVVVGAMGASAVGDGRLDVIINECTGEDYDCDAASGGDLDRRDRDGDWLSDALEVELETEPLDRDTDDDGLLDYYEVIGHVAVSGSIIYEQELVRYGAGPRRADLFLEFDRDVGRPLPPEMMIARAQTMFSDLPRWTNPDGTTGIRIHADIGQACANATLCGDWGGMEEFEQGVLYFDDYAAVAPHFGPARRGLFHYVSYVNCGTPQARPNGSSLRSCADQSIAYQGNTLVHELGHNLGLDHWGPRADPEATRFNRKAAYPSVMNYAYQNGLPGLPSGLSRFSEGRLATLDHRSLPEAGYAPGRDKQHLESVPYYWDVDGDTVDFNNDGRISSMPVMYDHGPSNRWRTGNGEWPELFQARDIHSALPTGGGAVVVDPLNANGSAARVFAFMPFAHPDGVYPDVAMVSDSVFGPEAAFTAWGGGLPLGGAVPLDPDGEVGAARIVLSGGAEIALVVMPDANGRLRASYYYLDEGYFWYWTALPGWPAGAEARSATVVNVGGKIAVLFRDLTRAENVPNVYMATMDAGESWSSWELLDVPSYHTPGLTLAPDGKLYLLYTQMTATGGGSIAITLQLASRPAAATSGSFTPVSFTFGDAEFGSSPIAPRNRTRLTVEFLPYLQGPGIPFADGSGYLAAFWTSAADMTKTDTWRALRAYTTGYIAPDGAHLGTKTGYPRAQVQSGRPFWRYSLGAARRWHDVASIYPGSVWNMVAVRPVLYQPFAAGTPPQPIAGRHDDNNDAATMRAFMCISLRSFTGDAATMCP